MYKTKAITIVLLLLAMLVVGGCSGTLARNSHDPVSGHNSNEGITQVPWYENGGIDINWPY